MNNIKRTPDGLLVATEPYFTEDDALRASEIACAVADAWVQLWGSTPEGLTPIERAVARLELATRGSPLRIK